MPRATGLELLRTAERFLGTSEIPGPESAPAIEWFHSVTAGDSTDDSIPWCASFVSVICWLYDLPRSRSRSARSWLQVGQPVALVEARPGDIVVLSRGASPTAGHVGFFDALGPDLVLLVSGNVGDRVTKSWFRRADVLGVVRVT